MSQKQQSSQKSLVDRIKTTLLGRYVALAIIAFTTPSCSPIIYTPKATPLNNSTIEYIDALVKIANEDCDEVYVVDRDSETPVIVCKEYKLTRKTTCTKYENIKRGNHYHHTEDIERFNNFCGMNGSPYNRRYTCSDWNYTTTMSLEVRWSLDLEKVANMKVLEYNLLHHYEITIALTTTDKSTLSLGFKSNNLGKQFADIIQSYLSDS